MKPPCEVVSKYLLPAIRAIIARKLIEKHGFTQLNAAAKLGLTQSAMSRYITLERGVKLRNIKEIQRLIEDITKDITKSQLSQEKIILKMCEICITFRESGALCELHRHTTPLPEKCEVCHKIRGISKATKEIKHKTPLTR